MSESKTKTKTPPRLIELFQKDLTLKRFPPASLTEQFEHQIMIMIMIMMITIITYLIDCK